MTKLVLCVVYTSREMFTGSRGMKTLDIKDPFSHASKVSLAWSGLMKALSLLRAHLARGVERAKKGSLVDGPGPRYVVRRWDQRIV